MVQSQVRPFCVEPLDVVLEVFLEPPYGPEEKQPPSVLLLHCLPVAVDLRKIRVAERDVAPPGPGPMQETLEPI